MSGYPTFRRGVGVGFLVALALGCAGGQKTAKTTEETKPVQTVQDFANMNEDFDPLSLKDDDLQFEEPEAAEAGEEDVDLLTAAEIQADSLVPGYRVQIFQTPDYGEAKEAQKDAILRFEQGVYWVFDPPFYKVRVGDFVNWFDAEQVQQLAIKKGYRDAWIVRTKVNLKKAYDWMKEW